MSTVPDIHDSPGGTPRGGTVQARPGYWAR